MLIAAAALFLGFLLFFASRPAEPEGELRPSNAVTEAFRSRRILPDRDYYFSGPESRPIAIIAVDRRFRFESAGLWRKAGEEPDRLDVLLRGMDSQALERNADLRGFEILGRRKERIGEWYSETGLRAVVRYRGTDVIEIDPPEPRKPEP